MQYQDAITGSAGVALNPEADGDAPVLWRSNCASMQHLERTILRVARTNIPVLVTGESGTGKEALARQIHRLSSRCNEPLVKAICASTHPDTLEAYFSHNGDSEVDGTTGPGTLFLKEISELEPGSQRAILYSIPGTDLSTEEAFPQPRVISSTTKNLDQEVHEGRFRAELYYRINGVCLRLPPLHERKEDIPALVELFLTKHAALLGQPRPRLDLQDQNLLQEHVWPGNIRELENVIRKIVILHEPKAVLSELLQVPNEPYPVHPATKGSSLKAATRAASRLAERRLILDALTRTRWNRKRAAQELQISYKSLLYKLKEIGTEEEDPV